MTAINPQLVEMIRNNQEQFLELLAGGGRQAVQPGGEPIGPQEVDIPVTQEERAAIDRVCSNLM